MWKRKIKESFQNPGGLIIKKTAAKRKKTPKIQVSFILRRGTAIKNKVSRPHDHAKGTNEKAPFIIGKSTYPAREAAAAAAFPLVYPKSVIKVVILYFLSPL